MCRLYGECSSIGRASACGAEGCGIVTRHSPIDNKKVADGDLFVITSIYIPNYAFYLGLRATSCQYQYDKTYLKS
ncbi:MAG: hypothetical protein UT43_C0019G0004 [Parcubacteria group bacterium GW2011_GWC1_39_29]|uniref:Uncharacterized protein n=1 Tax=Candidatus Yanofskybacteria bacterium GW2011_GWD1_39_16 TaxID=1619030 RepID=A0A837HSD1_9BACT|nr:MAG: hypothetical protein UT35_C0016G0008 [Candidatus Yanofskybacteria bacterium GW2011_GWD1_39_16]KKR14669.1 MAG: hypothetical protein UT43_C0019G0004 [Parcubacteria group bacterium GW2011_GWC1_39_29]